MKFFYLVFMISLFCGVPGSLAATALVTWDRSVSEDVVGYTVYYGMQSRNYEFEKDCGNVTECALSSLDEQTIYYIAAKAYNQSGQMSDYSNEAIFSESSVPIYSILGFAPLTVNFDASESNDSDGSIMEYKWDFGDGELGVGITTTHNFGAPGKYSVTLDVVDNDGAEAQAQVEIIVDKKPNVYPVPVIKAEVVVDLR